MQDVFGGLMIKVPGTVKWLLYGPLLIGLLQELNLVLAAEPEQKERITAALAALEVEGARIGLKKEKSFLSTAREQAFLAEVKTTDSDVVVDANVPPPPWEVGEPILEMVLGPTTLRAETVGIALGFADMARKSGFDAVAEGKLVRLKPKEKSE
jgi:hypothetical protein